MGNGREVVRMIGLLEACLSFHPQRNLTPKQKIYRTETALSRHDVSKRLTVLTPCTSTRRKTPHKSNIGSRGTD